MLGALLFWAARAFDWIGMGRGQDLWRAALMAAVLGGVALSYFLVLAALGMRPAHFMRRATSAYTCRMSTLIPNVGHERAAPFSGAHLGARSF